MALVATSTEVSNQDASPVVKQGPLVKGGGVRTAYGYLAAASINGDTVGQWYTMVRVPARARVLGIKVTNATTSSGTMDFGLYRSGGGVVIDADCFANNVAMTAHIRADICDAAVYTTALRKSSLRDAFASAITTAGATNDVEYDIAMTVSTTVIGTSTDTLVEVDFVLDE